MFLKLPGAGREHGFVQSPYFFQGCLQKGCAIHLMKQKNSNGNLRLRRSDGLGGQATVGMDLVEKGYMTAGTSRDD